MSRAGLGPRRAATATLLDHREARYGSVGRETGAPTADPLAPGASVPVVPHGVVE
ncbi:hypothetical protein [Halomarina ordinaria]|uniref:Uncharacterized protein n=1 Tax=Halomarina ordinaria TaxID=3033939 RepID=A0ABD5U3J9_9EURY|nr:hypothetical protein [Halomarina sp. PSRA2]